MPPNAISCLFEYCHKTELNKEIGHKVYAANAAVGREVLLLASSACSYSKVSQTSM